MDTTNPVSKGFVPYCALIPGTAALMTEESKPKRNPPRAATIDTPMTRPLVVGAVAAASLAPLTLWAAPKPKYTTKEIMEAIHKGKESLGKKVADGSGTPADFKKMVEYYTSLPLNDPPQGDVAVWKKKATALLLSAKALEAGKPGALDQYKEAVNCKACHSEFKPKDDHK